MMQRTQTAFHEGGTAPLQHVMSSARRFPFESMHLPRALRERVRTIFGSDQDRRSINGDAFLTCFVRLGQMERLVLSPGHAPSEVVVVQIPGVRALCTNPKYQWPFCYESSAKYLALLCAAGIFLKPRRKRGTGVCYYLPLMSMPGLHPSPELVTQLHQRRRKVRSSQALQRVCALLADAAPMESRGALPHHERPSLSRHEHHTEATDQQLSRRQVEKTSEQHKGEEQERQSPLQVREMDLAHAVHEMAQVMMQTYGFTVPASLKTQMIQILTTHLSGDAHSFITTSPASEKMPPTQEHQKEDQQHQKPPAQRTRTQRQITTGFSSMQDLLSERQFQREGRHRHVTKNGVNDLLPSSEESTISPKGLPPIEKSTFSPKSLPSSEESTIARSVKGLPSSERSAFDTRTSLPSTQGSTIFVKGLPSSEGSTISVKGLPPHMDESQHAQAHTHACGEFTHSLHSLKQKNININKNTNLSEKSESEEEKRGVSHVQKQSCMTEVTDTPLAHASMPPAQSISRAPQGAPQGKHQTDAQSWQPLANEQKQPNETLQMPHETSNVREDVPTSHSLLRQRLAEIRGILRDLPPASLRELAQDCSQRFSQSNDKTGVYLKRLHERPEILHLAAVDALVRTWFPDPGHMPSRLNAGWVLKRYCAYGEQGEEPSADIFAWARWVIEFGFTYEVLEMVLETAAGQQCAEEREYVRPLPHELVLDGACLDALRRQRFWTKGASTGMLAHGLLFVDLDGVLFTPQEFEQYRSQVLECALVGHPGMNEPVEEGELHAYLAWLASRNEQGDEARASLTYLSPQIQLLVFQLAEQIDHRRIKLCASQHPGTGEEVIRVMERHSPDNDWLLWTQDHVSLWLEAYHEQAL